MESLQTVCWGILGCGEATETKSGPAFPLVEGSKVVAVMSRERDRAESYARRNNIERFYTDALSLINDPQVNAVYIATPPSSHSTYAIMAMKAGKAVYVEKPLAVSYDECLRVNRISDLTGVPCYVAYYRRYLPYFQKVRELVTFGAIGKVLTVQIRFAVPPRELDWKLNGGAMPWRLQPEIAGGGGYFYDLASHQLDLLQYMFGDIIEAEGFCCNMGGLYEVEDTVNGIFKFDSGMSGSASWSFVAHESAREDRIHIVGTKGMVTFSVFDYKPIHLYREKGDEYIKIDNPQYVQLPLITNIVHALQGKGTCDCDSFSATSTNWVMDRMLGKF